MVAVGRGSRAVWRCGLVKNTSRDLDSSWHGFNISVKVVYIPVLMISDETINMMYKYVRRWHMYYENVNVTSDMRPHVYGRQATCQSSTRGIQSVCGRQATCQSSTRCIQSVVPNIHQSFAMDPLHSETLRAPTTRSARQLELIIWIHVVLGEAMSLHQDDVGNCEIQCVALICVFFVDPRISART